jgi:hypothetical protein
MSIEKALEALDKAREAILALQPKKPNKPAKAKPDTTKLLILGACKTPMTVRELCDKLDMHKSTLGSHVREMNRNGDIHFAGERKGVALWSSKPQPKQKTLTKWQPVQPWGVRK